MVHIFCVLVKLLKSLPYSQLCLSIITRKTCEYSIYRPAKHDISSHHTHYSVHHLDSDGMKPEWTESDRLQTQRERRMRHTHTRTHTHKQTHKQTHSVKNEEEKERTHMNTHTHKDRNIPKDISDGVQQPCRRKRLRRPFTDRQTQYQTLQNLIILFTLSGCEIGLVCRIPNDLHTKQWNMKHFRF